MARSIDENRLLSRITFITGLGDFISFFAVLVLIHRVSGSLLLAAYSVPMKSLGIAAGGYFLPFLLGRFQVRSLIIAAEVASAVLVLALLLMTFGRLNPYVVLGILLAQTALKQIFEGARETHSKSLGEIHEQRNLQSEILKGVFGAQTLGPVASFFLVQFLPIQIPLAIDLLSFIVAGTLAFQLRKDIGKKSEPLSVFKPLRYLWKSPGLRQIFLLRSVGYWIPVGIFNYLLFSVVNQHYGVDILNSAWVYAVIGLGSWIATYSLSTWKGTRALIFDRLTDGQVAALALAVLAVTRIGFIALPGLWVALGVVGVGGICNGLNAVATQSLRRKLTTQRQFPEIVGLELIVGKLTDWAVASVMFWAVSSGFVTFEAGIWVSAMVLVVLAWLHLGRRLRA